MNESAKIVKKYNFLVINLQSLCYSLFQKNGYICAIQRSRLQLLGLLQIALNVPF